MKTFTSLIPYVTLMETTYKFFNYLFQSKRSHSKIVTNLMPDRIDRARHQKDPNVTCEKRREKKPKITSDNAKNTLQRLYIL